MQLTVSDIDENHPIRKRAEWMVSSGQYRGTVDSYINALVSVPPGPIKSAQDAEHERYIAAQATPTDRPDRGEDE